MGKPKVAFFEFTSCEGCQLTVVDSLQTNVELLGAVEIVQFREAMSEKGQNYKIAFIEGSCTRPSDEAAIKRIREQAAIVVALGACAHLGGINAIRNYQELDDVRHYVYGDKADWYETYPARPINLKYLKNVLEEHGLDFEEAKLKMTMFLNYQMMELEQEAGNGNATA
jgi:sulfhydrogenase subunit delta